MADPQLSADHTRPNSGRGHLYNLQPDVVGQRPAVNEDPSQLIHPALPLEGVAREEGRHGALSPQEPELIDCIVNTLDIVMPAPSYIINELLSYR